MGKMRSAEQCAPKKCRCGQRLAKPRYGRPLNREAVWYIDCSCGITYVWSWHPVSNGCWKIRSTLPLWDSKEIVVVA